MLHYQILALLRMENTKNSYKNNKSKISFQHGTANVNYLIGHMIKKHETMTDNNPINIYKNKTENRVTFKIKSGYYLDLLMPKTIK